MGSDGSKPDFKELSKQSKYSTKELNDWYKKFKKDFPSGKINRPQFIELYKKMYGGGGGGAAAGGGGSGAGAVGADVNDFCDQIFRKYDADGDGTISFQEFMTTLSVASRGTPTEKLRWAFSMYDTDGNGYLTQKEITEILTAFYKSRGKENPSLRAIETAKEILKSADDDGDGRLSEAEFIRHSSNCDAIKEMLEGF